MQRAVLRMFSVAAIAVSAVALTATAAPAATSRGLVRQQAFHIAKPPSFRTITAAPSGCDLYRYCTYNQGNGGDLCEQMASTGNLNSACANLNQSGFNNRTVNSVSLFWGSGETGAYYNLGPGHYLLYMNTNFYNKCPGGGTGCSGYNQRIGDNLASVRFN
jgi:hypothetical protein